jgi:hypothetical protein
MFGRFFALELGCPDEEAPAASNGEMVAYLNDDGSISLTPPPGSQSIPEGATLVCECRGLGCKKCKRKKAKTLTLTGGRVPVPVMNVAQMPMAPWSPQMIMMGRSSIF